MSWVLPYNIVIRISPLFLDKTNKETDAQHTDQRWYLYAGPQPCLSDDAIREDLKLLLGQVACHCLQACIHLPLSWVAPPVKVLLLPNVDELAIHDKCAAPLSLCEAGVVDLNHSQFLLDVLLYAGIANKGVR